MRVAPRVDLRVDQKAELEQQNRGRSLAARLALIEWLGTKGRDELRVGVLTPTERRGRSCGAGGQKGRSAGSHPSKR